LICFIVIGYQLIIYLFFDVFIKNKIMTSLNFFIYYLTKQCINPWLIFFFKWIIATITSVCLDKITEKICGKSTQYVIIAPAIALVLWSNSEVIGTGYILIYLINYYLIRLQRKNSKLNYIILNGTYENNLTNLK